MAMAATITAAIAFIAYCHFCYSNKFPRVLMNGRIDSLLKATVLQSNRLPFRRSLVRSSITAIFSLEGLAFIVGAISTTSLSIWIGLESQNIYLFLLILFIPMVLLTVLFGWIVRISNWLVHGQPARVRISKMVMTRSGTWRVRVETLNSTPLSPVQELGPWAGELSVGSETMAVVNTNKKRIYFILLPSPGRSV